MKVKFKKLSDKAVTPSYAHNGDAGMDLIAVSVASEINECGQFVIVYHTGLAIEIPEGYVGYIFPRSSISKKSLNLTNCVAVIDSNYRGELILVFGLFGFDFEFLVLLERIGEFRFEVGSLSGLLLELLVVAFPAAFPAETLVDYAVDFLLGEGPQLRVVHVLWGRRVLFRLLLAVRAGLVFFCHGWWLLCLFLVSTPDAGELTAILVGFAHGCAPPHRWGVKGKRKAITFRRDGFLGFRDFPALFFARIRTAARRSTHSRRRTSASFLRS